MDHGKCSPCASPSTASVPLLAVEGVSMGTRRQSAGSRHARVCARCSARVRGSSRRACGLANTRTSSSSESASNAARDDPVFAPVRANACTHSPAPSAATWRTCRSTRGGGTQHNTLSPPRRARPNAWTRSPSPSHSHTLSLSHPAGTIWGFEVFEDSPDGPSASVAAFGARFSFSSAPAAGALLSLFSIEFFSIENLIVNLSAVAQPLYP